MSLFTLADLTHTDTGLDNTPDDAQISNLNRLEALLEDVYNQIGPFTVNSAFRSAAVNGEVGGAATSLHLTGQAADLLPHNMTPVAFFEAIARSPLRMQMGEIINEAERGIVHISTPALNMQGVLKYLLDGKYYRYTADQVNQIISGGELPGSGGDIISDQGEGNAVKPGSLGSVLMFAAVLAGTMLFVISRRKNTT